MDWCYGWQNLSGMAGMHGRGGFPGMMGMYGWGGGVFMMLFWILLIAGVVFLIVRLTRSNSGSRYTFQDEQDNAVNILRERLARGEINQEEYEEKMRLLKE